MHEQPIALSVLYYFNLKFRILFIKNPACGKRSLDLLIIGNMKKDETTKKQTNNEDVRKDLAEIKITIAILQEQVKKLAAVLNVVQPAMYTEEEYREMAEYRRRQK